MIIEDTTTNPNAPFSDVPAGILFVAAGQHFIKSGATTAFCVEAPGEVSFNAATQVIPKPAAKIVVPA